MDPRDARAASRLWCCKRFVDISPTCRVTDTPTRRTESQLTDNDGQLAEWIRQTAAVKNSAI